MEGLGNLLYKHAIIDVAVNLKAEDVSTIKDPKYLELFDAEGKRLKSLKAVWPGEGNDVYWTSEF